MMPPGSTSNTGSTSNNGKDSELVRLLADEIQKQPCKTPPVKLVGPFATVILVTLLVFQFVLFPSAGSEAVRDPSHGWVFWLFLGIYLFIYFGFMFIAFQAAHIWSHHNLKRMPKRIEKMALVEGKAGGNLVGQLLVQDKPGLGKILHKSKVGAWVHRPGTLRQIFCRELLSFEIQAGPFRALIEPITKTRPMFADFRWCLVYLQDDALTWLLPLTDDQTDRDHLAAKLRELDPDALVAFRLLMNAAADFGPDEQRANLQALLDATSF